MRKQGETQEAQSEEWTERSSNGEEMRDWITERLKLRQRAQAALSPAPLI